MSEAGMTSAGDTTSGSELRTSFVTKIDVTAEGAANGHVSNQVNGGVVNGDLSTEVDLPNGDKTSEEQIVSEELDINQTNQVTNDTVDKVTEDVTNNAINEETAISEVKVQESASPDDIVVEENKQQEQTDIPVVQEIKPPQQTDIPVVQDFKPPQQTDISLVQEKNQSNQTDISIEGIDELAPATDLTTITREGAVKIRMGTKANQAEKPVTLITVFKKTAERAPNHLALAVKRGGVWVKWTYKQYYADVITAAKSFIKLGLEPSHGVGILGFNSPEWLISDIGAIFAGGLATGIYATNTAEAVAFVAKHSEANILVVENNQQLQKVLQVWDSLPHLKAVVQYTGEVAERRENVYSWEEFMKLGTDVSIDVLQQRINMQSPNKCCTLIYTSGTTGDPKGVMLSHDNGSLLGTLKEVRPTGFFGVPRVWEKFYEGIKAQARHSGAFKKKIGAWARGVGLKGSYAMMNKQSTPFGWGLANSLVFKKARIALGLERCRFFMSGAAPIMKETLEFFYSLNMILHEVYGMSESSGPHTVGTNEDFRMCSVGQCFPGAETKLANQEEDGTGEICMGGRHVFMGYLNAPDKTEETFDKEGWLHSGDLGKHDQKGFLNITGRIKELIITAGGENIAPVPVEDNVKEALPCISNCMLIGDKRKFLSMILCLKVDVNLDTGEPTDNLTQVAKDWCSSLGSSATTVADVIDKKDAVVLKAIQDGIDKANTKSVSRASKVQKWSIIPRDFSIPGGELGPTLKLRRPVVTKMYKKTIDAFYDDGEAKK